MEKSIKIEIPEGYEIDKEKSTYSLIIFKKLIKTKPKSWKDMESIHGCYITVNSEISTEFNNFSTNDNCNKNIFPTRAEAEACLALSQLCQLRDVYNEGWKANYINDNEIKYLIVVRFNNLIRYESINTNYIMHFKTNVIRDEFMITFKDLLEIAKPLL